MNVRLPLTTALVMVAAGLASACDDATQTRTTIRGGSLENAADARAPEDLMSAGDGSDGEGEGESGETQLDAPAATSDEPQAGEGADAGKPGQSEPADAEEGDDEAGTDPAAAPPAPTKPAAPGIGKWGLRFEDSGRSGKLGDADFDDAELCLVGTPLALKGDRLIASADGAIAIVGFSDAGCKIVTTLTIEGAGGVITPVTIQSRDSAQSDPVVVPVERGAKISVAFKVVKGCSEIRGQSFGIGSERALISAGSCHLTKH